MLQLYRERYRGFNVRHFCEIARREHQVTRSYSWVKHALQTAGLVPKSRPRGRHRRRREPRACFGELLHIDGSPHAWFSLAPDTRATLIAVVDDATKRLLYAQLVVAESTQTVMTALREVITTYGLPMALYSDRAGWAFYTPKAKGPVDKTRVTQVGRALARLGIEHIPAYSAQARGRSERANRTIQDRLVNELRVAGITTLAAANAYLRDVFIPHYNETFSHPPRDLEPAWVAIGDVDLDQILCHEEARVVGQNNTVADRCGGRCRSRNNRGDARAPVTSRDRPAPPERPRTRSGGARSGGASMTRPVGPWTLPRLGNAPEAGVPQGAWTDDRRRSPAHSAHRRHFSESGQITCQTQAVNSLVNNRNRIAGVNAR